MSEHSDVDSVQEVSREPLNQHQEKLDAYLADLLHEKMHINREKYPHAYRLIDEGIIIYIFVKSFYFTERLCN